MADMIFEYNIFQLPTSLICKLLNTVSPLAKQVVDVLVHAGNEKNRRRPTQQTVSIGDGLRAMSDSVK